MSGMAEVLAAHQKASMGMTYGSPDTCRCGEQVYPERDHDTEVSLRRDVAFAAHQAAALAAAGFGPVKEAAAKALEDAADAIEPSWFQYHGGSKDMNDGKRTWLRARAAAVRGES